MTSTDDRQHRSILVRIARRAMLERGLRPDFSLPALAELDGIRRPATRAQESTRDLRNLIWCSIDNDASRDLDQLTAAEIFPMLPEKLSTDLTSLNYESDRLTIVIEMVIAGDGSLQGSDI